jgi:hypothetical protein
LTHSMPKGPLATAPIIGIVLATLALSGCSRLHDHVNERRGDSQHASTATPSGAIAPTKPAAAPPEEPPVVVTCAQCEGMAHAGSTNCPDSLARCDALRGNTAAASPMPGVPKAQLCRKILDCVHTTHCAKEFNATDCLCGKNADPNVCFAASLAAATGTCKDLMAAGGESASMADLATRFSDPTFAVGAADAVIETCDYLACARECL